MPPPVPHQILAALTATAQQWPSPGPAYRLMVRRRRDGTIHRIDLPPAANPLWLVGTGHPLGAEEAHRHADRVALVWRTLQEAMRQAHAGLGDDTRLDQAGCCVPLHGMLHIAGRGRQDDGPVGSFTARAPLPGQAQMAAPIVHEVLASVMLCLRLWPDPGAVLDLVPALVDPFAGQAGPV